MTQDTIKMIEGRLDKNIKLNLGSGNKPLEGWWNVDLNHPREILGKDEYTLIFDDVTVLSNIQEESVSTILASHIIEHIHPKKVDAVLKLWYDKLFSGGTIMLEQPDIIKCCINVLQIHNSDPNDIALQFGLWGLYGDSKHEGDGMAHKWGWTPITLAQKLKKVGFVDIKERTPQMKPWAAHNRDFKLEARKP